MHVGESTAAEIGRYQDLGIDHVVVELPTEPRDETFKYLDGLQKEFAQLT